MQPENAIPFLSGPKKIGIYGGSFNPPHIGHTLVILAAMSEYALDQVWVIPCADHPVKKDLISFGHRFKMSQMAFSCIKDCEVLPLESGLPKPSFTADTLRFISENAPEADLHLIVGEDSFKEMHTWKDSGAIKTYAKTISVPRPKSSDEDAFLPNISSTKVRDCIRKGLPIKAGIDHAVHRYILYNALYCDLAGSEI